MEPMQVCFSHQTAFQVLRAIDARELAGSGDTARRLPARAPSARELEEVVKRIENDRPGLSIERPVHILLGAASRCRSTSRRVSHVWHTADAWEVLAPAVGRCWRMQCAVCLRSGGSVSEKQDRSA